MNTESTAHPGYERLSEKSLVVLLVSVFVLFSASVSSGGSGAGSAASRAESHSAVASVKAALASATRHTRHGEAFLGGGADKPDLAAAPTALEAAQHQQSLLGASALSFSPAAARPFRLSPLAPRAPPFLA